MARTPMMSSGMRRSVMASRLSLSRLRPTLLRQEEIMKMLNQASVMPRSAASCGGASVCCDGGFAADAVPAGPAVDEGGEEVVEA